MNACGVAVNPSIGGIPSQRTPFTVPRRTRVSAGRGSLRRLGLRGLNGSGRQVGGNVASLHTARVEGKFIDNQLAGADKQGGVAARRDWNCNGDRRAGRKQLLWSEDGAKCWSTARGLPPESWRTSLKPRPVGLRSGSRS